MSPNTTPSAARTSPPAAPCGALFAGCSAAGPGESACATPDPVAPLRRTSSSVTGAACTHERPPARRTSCPKDARAKLPSERSRHQGSHPDHEKEEEGRDVDAVCRRGSAETEQTGPGDERPALTDLRLGRVLASGHHVLQGPDHTQLVVLPVVVVADLHGPEEDRQDAPEERDERD